ncbi:MAG: fumarylacetoacetate hydrolase family protein [Chloroflexi bacterium]|nr:fumarylacetoacetate hydrolase family protein [Chloroflexota bacterium]
MKLVLFDNYRPGALTPGGVVDLSPAMAPLGDLPPGEVMPALVAHFEYFELEIADLLDSAPRLPLDGLSLRAPNPRPGKLLCCVGNYREFGHRAPEPIDWFYKSPESVIGPGDTVVLPPHPATIFHHEAELAVVIGKRCRNVSASEAMDAVFGYTCFIDVSARNLGRPVGTFFGKSFDTFGPMGPCIVTADDVPNPHKLRVRLWVNGDLRQDYGTDDMANRIPALIEHASSIMTLHPGDMISCGTNHQGLGALQDKA